MRFIRRKLPLTFITLWLKHILTHCLQLSKDVDPLLLCKVQLLLYPIDLIIYIIIKLLIEPILYVLVQIYINVVIWSLHHWLLLGHLVHV